MKKLRIIIGLTLALLLLAGPAFSADQTIASTEEMVGSGHATKTDTLNRLGLVEHNTDGTHKAAITGLAVTAGKTVTATQNTSLDEAVAMSSKLTIPGAWTTPTFDAANFSASGAMTWTVEAGDVLTYAHTTAGKVMTFAFAIGGSSVGGTPAATLKLNIPDGKTATKMVQVPIIASDNGTSAVGMASVNPGYTYLLIYNKAIPTNWAAATNTTEVYGQITFEIN